MALRILAAAFLLAAGGEAGAASPSEVRRAALDRDMPSILAKHGVPSVSIAKVERGKVVLVAAYGEQSPGVRATPRTLYNVASLTKPISAEVVLRLAAKGRLGLDEPMHRHWVDPDVAGDPRHRLLTPKLALSHRTGFPNWRFLAPDGKLAFAYPPGQGIGYSGEGYEWVARFAARKAGEDFETLAKKLVFDPAGMTETAYTRRPWFAGRLAVGTDGEGRPVPAADRSDYVASDDLHTTAEDYARFMISAMSRQGISDKIARQRESVQASTRDSRCQGGKAAACPAELGFGLGWEVHVYGGETILFHTGADRGEFALAFFNPRSKSGAVVLTNSGNAPLVILAVLDRIGVDPALLRFLHSQAGR
jgi:CubicO group peptidase (beta-lactamase class C family)